jgi:type VI secretion system secreted protein VgrG
VTEILGPVLNLTGTSVKLTGSDSAEVTSGSARFREVKDGTITLTGKDITIEGSGNVRIRGSSVTTN